MPMSRVPIIDFHRNLKILNYTSVLNKYFLIMSEQQQPTCILCNKKDTDIPLIVMSYNRINYYLCPEHLPILIHKPDALVGKLPGAENMNAG